MKLPTKTKRWYPVLSTSTCKFYTATRQWYPEISSLLLGKRNGQFYFRPDIIAVALFRSLVFLSEVYRQGKPIWFFSTREEIRPIVAKMAKRIKQRHINGKWVAGSISNECIYLKKEFRPGCLVLFDPTEDILRDARTAHVPVISLLTSRVNVINSRKAALYRPIMKSTICYLIPGPNYSIDFVYYVCNKIYLCLKDTKSQMRKSQMRSGSLRR